MLKRNDFSTYAGLTYNAQKYALTLYIYVEIFPLFLRMEKWFSLYCLFFKCIRTQSMLRTIIYELFSSITKMRENLRNYFER